jgi:hypothetical protein
MTSSGIEPATFRLVSLCLNQLRYRVPHVYIINELSYYSTQFINGFLLHISVQASSDHKRINGRISVYREYFCQFKTALSIYKLRRKDEKRMAFYGTCNPTKSLNLPQDYLDSPNILSCQRNTQIWNVYFTAISGTLAP